MALFGVSAKCRNRKTAVGCRFLGRQEIDPHTGTGPRYAGYLVATWIYEKDEFKKPVKIFLGGRGE
jgi:hypothetical protein